MRYEEPTDRQSEEILYLKDFVLRCPILMGMLVFLLILAVGGVLRMSFAVFTILAIAGGFALPVIYGGGIGLSPLESIVLCLAIFLFLSYGSLCILTSFEDYARAKRYLKMLKNSFRPVYRFLNIHAGRFGIFGILALSTFLVGWWLAVILAFVADLEIPYAVSAIFVGLVGGGLLAWGLYYGIETVIHNTLILAAIFIGLGLVTGTITNAMIGRMRRRRRKPPKK